MGAVPAVVTKKAIKNTVSARTQSRLQPVVEGIPISQIETSQEPLYLQRKCSCGGGCPSCSAIDESIQLKLKIGAANDKYEQEADQVADQVMRLPDTSPLSIGEKTNNRNPFSITPIVQRQEVEEAEDENDEAEFLQTKKVDDQRSEFPDDLGAYARSLNLKGQPLPKQAGEFFESRMNRDFSKVRIHTDNEAAKSATSINAKAYTVGNNIAFGHGQYSPDTFAGKRLLAHELTHVVQQGESEAQNDQIQRTVSDRSSCPANTNGAPALPEIDLTLAEVLVGADLTMARIGLIVNIQSLQAGNRPQRSASFNAYLTRFGLPERLSNGRYRDRFSGSQFATEDGAVEAELTQLKYRLERIQDIFSRSIRYICASERRLLTIGNCTERCVDQTGEAFAWVCRGGGAGNTIVICPAFWLMLSNDQSIGLIHEAAHLVFGFGDPSGASMTTRRRARNPVCYSGFVASVSGRNPPDSDCPPVPGVAIGGSTRNAGNPGPSP
jgi:hypothetical protein